jgi:hypothetical protein
MTVGFSKSRGKVPARMSRALTESDAFSTDISKCDWRCFIYATALPLKDGEVGNVAPPATDSATICQ